SSRSTTMPWPIRRRSRKASTAVVLSELRAGRAGAGCPPQRPEGSPAAAPQSGPASALIGFQPVGYLAQAAHFTMGGLCPGPFHPEPVEPQRMQADRPCPGDVIHRMVTDMQRLGRLHAGAL